MQELINNERQSTLLGCCFTAIILAGGLGTRLRSVVNDVPKCMAPVNGIPFINFVVTWLKNEGVQKFIFSLGYKHELLTGYLDQTFPLLDKVYNIEEQPLGTGGAIKKSFEYVTDENAIVVNGDTLFNVDISNLFKTHTHFKPACSLALKEMRNFDRYGTVETNKDDYIVKFSEKKYCEKGLINGGIYIINKQIFLSKTTGEVFSFEKDFLEKYVDEHQIMGFQKDYYFIDIGIPEDYQKFQDDYRLILSKNKYHKSNSGDLVGDFLEALIELFD